LLILQAYSVAMIIHNGYENLHLVNPVVTMGIFDGVHRGHCALLEHLVLRAKEVNGESVVITFSPHPRLVLNKNHAELNFLTSMEEKVSRIEMMHVDHLVIIEFNERFSQIGACDFVKDILVGRIGTKNLIVGFNHHFGSRGEGDFDTITQCAGLLDFKVERLQGFHAEGETISSSSIRKALHEGRLDEANRSLGYFYSLTGTVVGGRRIGRSIGFPTANIKSAYEYKLIPDDGVYAVEVHIDGFKFAGMLSIGSNPTVNTDKENKSIEVHILNYNEDIYGRTISVVFRKRLREEIKFDNTDQLKQQMELDKEQVLLLLG